MKVNSQPIWLMAAGFLVLSFVLTPGLVNARQGADDPVSSTDDSQGLKLRGDGTVDDTQPVQVQAQAQNQVQNQGDMPQVQAQQQEVVGSQNQPSANQGNGKGVGQANAVDHRSAVANFVQSLLEVADRDGGIGEQVRAIAQEQNAAEDRTIQAMEKVQTRSKIRTFLFGSDYKNLGSLRSETVQTRNRLQQLNQLMTTAQNEADKTELQNQLQALEQEQVKIENFIRAQETKISLFGWLARLRQ